MPFSVLTLRTRPGPIGTSHSISTPRCWSEGSVCEGDAKEGAARELIDLVTKLGGKIAALSHSKDELRSVLQGAANYLESPDARGAVVVEARDRGTTRSDLLLLAEGVDEELQKVGISVEGTPRYSAEFQIDEALFGETLEDEISYYNPRAKEYDINSVRSIYVLRAGKPAPTLEKVPGGPRHK